jgi:hypothetical protein
MKALKRFWYIPVIGILLFTNIKSCKSYFDINKELGKHIRKDALINQQVQKSATIISRKVDEFGLKHVTIAEAENILPRVLINDAYARPGVVDSIASTLNINNKQIESITIINSTLMAENLVLKKNIDSLKRVFYTYKDNFLAVKFKPANTVDTLPTFDYKYNAKLNYAEYWKRKFPIIGAKKNYIDIWSDDPRTTINGVDRLKIEQKQQGFGLRVQMRSIYSISSQKLFAGPGLSFDFNRYNLLGYSYYNLTDNRWQYAIGINYDLIRF